MMGGGFGMGMGWWWIIGIIVLIAIVWPIVQRSNRNNITGQEPRKSALDILKERYASGEIDKQEFEERKKDIE
ncbi:SHOCT domain-containing protein [Sunxiuqinia indica]|uniref:SHOCT domain-containing protein n=1 Tax=Sunxiuqinia indica TaxID=2692584 RepID=UPI001357FEF0|nr:SHOCT domain-containing protein [Sunxiuqinia indica]